MQPRTFLRLEDKNGNGIFCADLRKEHKNLYAKYTEDFDDFWGGLGTAAVHLDGWSTTDNDTHPTPRCDPGLSEWFQSNCHITDQYYFAFENMDQLCSWFGPKARAFLADCGAVLCEVTTDTYVVGKRQVCFHSQTATITRKPLAEWLNT